MHLLSRLDHARSLLIPRRAGKMGFKYRSPCTIISGLIIVESFQAEVLTERENGRGRLSPRYSSITIALPRYAGLR